MQAHRSKRVYIIANFGGPRNLAEVEAFLVELLTDEDVIRTSMPSWFQRLFFTWVAKRRAKRVVHDYAAIGGASPIFEDTEAIARALEARLGEPVLAFHRYLPETHARFTSALCRALPEEIRVVPMYPQFSYTTTGGSARWLQRHLPREIIQQLRWVRSYPEHPAYLEACAARMHEALRAHGFAEARTHLLFSAHGLPKRFVREGDPYAEECERTFRALAKRFPQAESVLCFQSQFGKEPWIEPATQEVCAQLTPGERDQALLIPLSFTSDHLETLFEMEQLYLPLLRKRGFRAARCPALNRDPRWLDALERIAREDVVVENACLMR